MATGRDATLSRAAAVQFALDEVHVDGNTCRHAINNATYRLAMTLAECRQREYVAKSIHIVVLVTSSTTAAVAVTLTAVLMTAATASAAASAHAGYHATHLVLGSLTVLQYFSYEMQGFASQRVVQVHFHLLFSNLHNLAVETVAVLVLQGHYRIHKDMFVVKLAVDGKDGAVQLHHMLQHVVTVSLLLLQREVEVLSGNVNQFFLKGIQCDAEA